MFDPRYYRALCVLTIWLIVLASLLFVAGVYGQFKQTVVFDNALEDVTGANECSDPIRNIGQTMHLVQVSFPDENTAVSSIQIQFQFSRDGANWRKLGKDITDAPVVSEGIGATDVIAYGVYYGTFRAIRVCSVLATPGGEELDVRYIGHELPVVPFITKLSDRWEFGFTF